MHNKSLLILIAMLASIGGWFLWNILFAIIYSQNTIYKVKGALFHGFGKSILWWFTLIFIILAVLVLEIAVSAMRTALWPTDADVFQELERDLKVRKRFEEAAQVELRQGWEAAAVAEAAKGRKAKGKKIPSLKPKISSFELRRGDRERKRQEVAEREQDRRERDVEEILRNRPDKYVDPARTRGNRLSIQEGMDEVERGSRDVEAMLKGRFGSVRRPGDEDERAGREASK